MPEPDFLGLAQAPARVFHGTGHKIDRFRTSRSRKSPRTMLFFTGDMSVGNHYAFIRSEGRQQPRVYSVDMDWRGQERLPMYNRNDGSTLEEKIEDARSRGYPALWVHAGMGPAPELIVFDDRKVGIDIVGSRQLQKGVDHEGWLSDIGMAYNDIQREAIAQGEDPPMSVDDCRSQLQARFANAEDRDLKYGQIDDLCEQKSKAFTPTVEPKAMDYEVIEIDPNRTFYHGTNKPEFEQLARRSSVTTDPEIAKRFAVGDGFEGEPRVLELRTNIKQAPIIPMTEGMLDMDEEDPFAPYHEFAEAEARKHGFGGYVTQLFNAKPGEIGELVVIDPDSSLIVSQDIEKERVMPAQDDAIAKCIEEYKKANGDTRERERVNTRSLEYRGMPKEPKYRERRGRGGHEFRRR